MATSLLANPAALGAVAEQVATFIKILNEYLALGKANAKVVRSFVKLVTKLPYDADFEDTRKDYPVDRWGDDYMRSIIERPTGFKPDYADEILDYLDTTELEKKVRALVPTAKDRLSKALRIFDASIGRTNLVEWVGDKAAELIAECSEKDFAYEIAMEKVSLARQAFARDEYENFLMGEAEGLCSFTSCRKPLLASSSGKPVTDVVIVIIDPHGDTASPANLLACCHDCAVSYGPEPSPDDIAQAKIIKKEQQRNHKISDIVAKRDVEEAIAKVVQQLPDADQTDLNIEITDPLRVRTKLPDPRTVVNGQLFELPPLEHHINASASSLLPSPQARDGDSRGTQSPGKRRAGGHQPSIADVLENL